MTTPKKKSTKSTSKKPVKSSNKKPMDSTIEQVKAPTDNVEVIETYLEVDNEKYVLNETKNITYTDNINVFNTEICDVPGLSEPESKVSNWHIWVLWITTIAVSFAIGYAMGGFFF
jgi:hypothetical protein